MQADVNISDVPVNNPICLMIGNENRGLSTQAQDACDLTYRIPMHGMSESLNLSVSAAISLYDTTQRKRALLNNAHDLSPTQQLNLRAHYYLHSVNHNTVDILFKWSPHKKQHQD